VAKIYIEEQKYDSTNSSFDHKLTIFLDICNRVKLLEEGYLRAFLTMLKGLALDYFYNAKLLQRTYLEACDNIRGFFKGLSYYRHNLDQWNAITLRLITTKNPKKSTYENV
jgi:hypothetical protein